jgi:hypothetical protein
MHNVSNRFMLMQRGNAGGYFVAKVASAMPERDGVVAAMARRGYLHTAIARDTCSRSRRPRAARAAHRARTEAGVHCAP